MHDSILCTGLILFQVDSMKAKACLLEVMQQLCQWILTQQGLSSSQHQAILPAECGLWQTNG